MDRWNAFRGLGNVAARATFSDAHITTAATVALALLTAGYVIYTQRFVKVTRDSNSEMRRALREQSLVATHPHLTCELDLRRSDLVPILENHGELPELDVDVVLLGSFPAEASIRLRSSENTSPRIIRRRPLSNLSKQSRKRTLTHSAFMTISPPFLEERGSHESGEEVTDPWRKAASRSSAAHLGLCQTIGDHLIPGQKIVFTGRPGRKTYVVLFTAISSGDAQVVVRPRDLFMTGRRMVWSVIWREGMPLPRIRELYPHPRLVPLQVLFVSVPIAAARRSVSEELVAARSSTSKCTYGRQRKRRAVLAEPGLPRLGSFVAVPPKSDSWLRSA